MLGVCRRSGLCLDALRHPVLKRALSIGLRAVHDVGGHPALLDAPIETGEHTYAPWELECHVRFT